MIVSLELIFTGIMTSKRDLERSLKRLLKDAEASGFHVAYQDHDFNQILVSCIPSTLDAKLHIIKAKPCHPAYKCSYTHYGHTFVKIHNSPCPLRNQ